MKNKPFLIFPILFLLGWIGSCSNNKTVEIYTDNPNLVLIGEIFNMEDSGYTVLFHYTENIESDLKEKYHPDLVIGEYLNTEGFQKLYVPFGKDFPIEQMYSFLFCGEPENPVLMPLSFSLPVILAKEKNLLDFKNPVLTDIDEVRKKSILFSTKVFGKTHMGFSPLWDDSFLFYTISQFSPEFSISKNGIDVNTQTIDPSIEYIRSWSKEEGGTVRESVDFSQRYRIIPDVELLSEERIGFSFCDLEALFDLSMKQNEEFGYRYLAEGNKISLDRVVYAALPKRAKNKKGARFFVRWLLNPEVQKRILERQKVYSGEQKGFLIGFSSFPTVNEDILPGFFPQLDGHVPGPHFYSDVKVVPQDWHNLKTTVILPWFRERILNNSKMTLSEYYNEWILHAIVE